MSELERPELADTVAEPTVQSDIAILERGSALGRYLILELLGAGGMGAVYAAYDPELDRKVAVKLVLSGADGSVERARILREAQAIARLSHTNVVTVHDVGTCLEQVFVAMELIDGVTVTAWLGERPRELGEILAVFAQAGRGLAAAHRAGLVHRDFKPDNVLVGRDGRVCVVDFGLVREVDAEPPASGPETAEDPTVPSHPGWRMLSVPLTQVGALMGTPDYMAPEQFLRAPTDARTDQFNFCASLYQAIHGRPPFAGRTVAETASNVLGGRLPEPPGKLPPRLRALLRRGLSADPAARFPTMDAVLEELEPGPRSRRRRWVAAAAAVLGAAAGMLLLARGGESQALCRGAGEELASAWNPTRQRALEQAFAATGAPYAADSARAVGRVLARYASDWRQSYQDSCEATRISGHQSAEMQDLRSACLSRRRSELDALVDLLVEADAATVERSVAAAGSLPAVADCDDLEALQAPMPPPTGGQARRAVAEMRDALARLQALTLAGRYQEGIRQAEALRARAGALGYLPLEAEIVAELAELQVRSGDPAASTRSLLDAMAAATAGKHDGAAVSISIALVQSLALTQEFDRARDWALFADGALRRTGDPPEHRAHLHLILGNLLFAEGKLPASVEEHERALAIRERLSASSLATARSLSTLAHVYDEVGRYREARAAGERSLAIQEAELGRVHPDVGLVLNNLGNIAVDEGDLARATGYYQRSLAIREKTAEFGDDPAGVAHVLNNLGGVAFAERRLDDALAFYRRALAVYEELDPAGPNVAMTVGNIATAQLQQGAAGLALAGFRRALAIAEEAVGAEHYLVADALCGLGQASLELGRVAEAEPALERAIAIRRTGGRPTELAEAEFALARTLWARGRRARSLGLARSTRAVYAETPGSARELAEIDDWLRARASR